MLHDIFTHVLCVIIGMIIGGVFVSRIDDVKTVFSKLKPKV